MANLRSTKIILYVIVREDTPETVKNNVVINKFDNRPSVVYHSYDEAEKEAKRLSNNFRSNTRFHILKSIKVFWSPIVEPKSEKI